LSLVTDFKSIARKLNRMEQKADLDEKNPKAEPAQPTWHPQWGYGMAPANATPLCDDMNGVFWRDINFKI